MSVRASTPRLGSDFYGRGARQVAQDLLGTILVRCIGEEIVSGLIVEVEAYCDSDERDLACHGDKANSGKPTKRTKLMFGPPGFAYVYFTYGMHWMLNFVTGKNSEANAVLIRAIEPQEGQHIMERNRADRDKLQWTNGPAKLAQALSIDGSLNGANLCESESVIWVEPGTLITTDQIIVGPRIGLGKTPEPWLSIPWRYWIRGNPYVSK